MGRSGTAAGGGRSGRHRCAKLKALARSQRATFFVALLAGFQTLLHRYTGETDFAVGSLAAGRPRGFARTMGYFTNPLVLRADLAGEPTFRDLLSRAREKVAEALDHQHLPLPLLTERLRSEGMAGDPFQALVVFHRDPPGREGMGSLAMGEAGGCLRWGDLAMEPLDLPPRSAQFDLTLAAVERRGALGLQLVYRAARFDATTAARWLEHLATLLEAAAARPDAPIADLPLLTPWERQQVLLEVNDRGGAAPSWSRLEEGFERQAERTPDAVAVVDGERRISYRELNERAGRLALELRQLGAGPERVVGISLPRTPEMIVAMLAVLEAGAAYLPLDPAYPEERIAFLLADAGVGITIPRDGPGRIPPLPGLVEGRWERGPGGEVAYLIYTSGSTGRPKGVAIEHAGAVRLVAWALETFTAGELSGVLAFTSINFDLSVFEIFVPLSCGGTAILAENALALPSLPAAGEVTLVNTVPSAMAALLEMGPLPPSVCTVNLAGEPLRRSLADRVLSCGVRLWDLYGPSEDTTYSTGARVQEGDPFEPAIGWPVAGSRAWVVDAGLRPLPVGLAGELCLGGGGLARGYLGRPELTAERFVPDPLSGAAGERIYRTGDLARRRTDGSLEYLGRLDHQVKIRGFRIEPGEIEAALLAHPAVREAVVVARGGALVAYVSLAAEAPAAEPRCLVAILPAGGVRAVLVRRAGCAAPDAQRQGGPQGAAGPRGDGARAGEPPVGMLEEALAGIWGKVLGRGRIGRHESFFDLGGHSLLATQVGIRVSRRFGVELPVAALLQAPTVAELARRIAAGVGGAAAAPPIAPALRPHERREDLPLSFAQERLWFLDQLQPGGAAYNMPGALWLDGPLSVPALAAAFSALARRHETLRTRFGRRDGRPVQIVAPAAPVPLPVADLSGLPAARRDGAARALALEEAARPFDLASGPLLRLRLLRLGTERHLLPAALHHIIADGWSLGVLLAEIGVLYSGAFRSELPIQYADWAVWQRARLAGPALEAQLAWWKERLAGAPASLELPADRAIPATATERGFQIRTALPADRADGLRELARRHGATLFPALLAAFQVFLARTTGQDDLLVGSAVAHRTAPEVEGLIGLFATTLVLRSRLAGGPSFAGVLEQARDETLAALAHQDLPVERLIEELSRSGSPAGPRCFRRSSCSRARRCAAELPGLTLHRLPLDTGTAKFDLALELTEAAHGSGSGSCAATSSIRRRGGAWPGTSRPCCSAPWPIPEGGSPICHC